MHVVRISCSVPLLGSRVDDTPLHDAQLAATTPHSLQSAPTWPMSQGRGSSPARKKIAIH